MHFVNLQLVDYLILKTSQMLHIKATLCNFFPYTISSIIMLMIQCVVTGWTMCLSQPLPSSPITCFHTMQIKWECSRITVLHTCFLQHTSFKHVTLFDAMNSAYILHLANRYRPGICFYDQGNQFSTQCCFKVCYRSWWVWLHMWKSSINNVEP